MDVAEGGDVADVEERDVAQRDRLGEAQRRRDHVELRCVIVSVDMSDNSELADKRDVP